MGSEAGSSETEIAAPPSGDYFHAELGAPESVLAYFHWRVSARDRGGDLKLILRAPA